MFCCDQTIYSTMFVFPLSQNAVTSVLLFSLTHWLSFLQSYSFICLLFFFQTSISTGCSKYALSYYRKVGLKSVIWRNYCISNTEGMKFSGRKWGRLIIPSSITKLFVPFLKGAKYYCIPAFCCQREKQISV